MDTKAILGVVPGLQATALVGYNLKNLNFDMKPGKKGKISPKKIVKTGVGTMLGIGLIKPTASMINSL